MQFGVALERVIAAPRSKVYRAWLDPALLARWMGPDGFSVTVATVDERVGGVYEERITMEGTLDTMSVNIGWGQTLAKLQALCEASFQPPYQQGDRP